MGALALSAFSGCCDINLGTFCLWELGGVSAQLKAEQPEKGSFKYDGSFVRSIRPPCFTGTETRVQGGIRDSAILFRSSPGL